MQHYTYFGVLAGCLIVPFIFSFYPRIQFYKAWRNFFIPCLLVSMFFIVWDVLFTHLGVWGFSPSYIVQYYVWNLPIEEVLFFVIIPYCSVFVHFCFKRFLPFQPYTKSHGFFTIFLIVSLLIVGALNPLKLYTSITFILLALSLIYVMAYKKHILPLFYISYSVILLPFMMSNGILTGGFLGRVVVWYNHDYFLGYRFYTIPIEDVFYGMLLILWNILGYSKKD